MQDSGFRDKTRYEEAIRKSVCSHCIDFCADHVCHNHDPEGCTIFKFLPELILIAENLHERKMEHYIHAVREGICAKCSTQAPDGTCELRDKVECALFRYVELVFDTIEAARRE